MRKPAACASSRKGVPRDERLVKGMPTPDARPARNLRSRPRAGIRACASSVSPSHKSRRYCGRLSQWHRDTPQQSLTVAGAAQELRRLKTEPGGHAPVSRLTPPKNIGRGTRERAGILTYRRATVAFEVVRMTKSAGSLVVPRLAAESFIGYAKAHSKKSVSS